MKGDRIKARKQRERILEFQVALTLFLQDYNDIDHYDRSGVLWQFAKNEIYSYAFDDGVAHEAEEARAAVRPPAATEASKAWEQEEKAQAAKAEILPPEGGEKLNALRIDLRAFQTTVRELAQVTETLRKIVDAATDDGPIIEEDKPRGRGRPRRNGR